MICLLLSANRGFRVHRAKRITECFDLSLLYSESVSLLTDDAVLLTDFEFQFIRIVSLSHHNRSTSRKFFGCIQAKRCRAGCTHFTNSCNRVKSVTAKLDCIACSNDRARTKRGSKSKATAITSEPLPKPCCMFPVMFARPAASPKNELLPPDMLFTACLGTKKRIIVAGREPYRQYAPKNELRWVPTAVSP